jgi:hypothetical protein
MKRILFISIFTLFYSITVFSQGNFCIDSEPFCTSNLYSFPAGTSGTNAEPGPNYDCLSTTPNPAWYHMKIAVAGSFNIRMFSTPSEDIDFICWGPFLDPVDPCDGQLTLNKKVACSYSNAAVENCAIPNGQVGEYYILLITNFSQNECNITFEKTSGTGETDCTIVPPPIGSNSPLCYGDDLQLWADNFTNASYHWTGPNNWSSDEQNPLIGGVDLVNSGDYELIITVNGSASDPVTTRVEVFPKPNPDFTFNDACFGDTTFFIDNSTVTPTGETITNYQWDFGNGQSSTIQSPNNLYTTAGEYDVSLTTRTGISGLGCPQTITKTVNVFNAASVQAGADQTLPNGWAAQLESTINGGSGNYDILWTPENLVTDPTLENPMTNPLGATEVFTITVTDSETQCVNSDNTTVIITGGALSVATTAIPTIFCQDNNEIIHLSANPNGGSGNNTYSWTSNPPGFTADIKEPSDFPNVTTTYYCSVFDGQTTATSEITVTAKPKPTGNAGEDKSITVGTSTFLDAASVSGGSGSYNFSWTPTSMLVQSNVLQPQTNNLDENTEFSLVINDDNGCKSESDEIWIFTGGSGLNVNPTPSEDVICLNEFTTLKANAIGGGGVYTYYWFSENGWESTETEPQVSPTETTIYTVEVNDGFKTVSNTTTVFVNPLPIVDLLPNGYEYFGSDTIKACVKDSVVLDAGNIENPANMNYLWSNTATSRKQSVTTTGSWIDFKTYTVEVQNPVTLCSQNAKMTVFFDFNECEIGINEINSLHNNINISPNPSNGIFNIEVMGLEKTFDISIEDINGRNIFNEKNIDIKSDNFIKIVDLTDFPKGIYLISITHESGVLNSKIIKQ